MDPETGSHPRWLTSGQDTWSARCAETRTPGAAGGPGKPTGSNPGRAPRSDPTGAFYRSRLHRIALRIDEHIVRWAMQKFKRLRGRPLRAWAWLKAVRQRQPRFFAPLGPHCTCLRSACGSPVRGDPHAGLCESRGVRLPPATHLVPGALIMWAIPVLR